MVGGEIVFECVGKKSSPPLVLWVERSFRSSGAPIGARLAWHAGRGSARVPGAGRRTTRRGRTARGLIRCITR